MYFFINWVWLGYTPVGGGVVIGAANRESKHLMTDSNFFSSNAL